MSKIKTITHTEWKKRTKIGKSKSDVLCAPLKNNIIIIIMISAERCSLLDTGLSKLRLAHRSCAIACTLPLPDVFMYVCDCLLYEKKNKIQLTQLLLLTLGRRYILLEAYQDSVFLFVNATRELFRHIGHQFSELCAPPNALKSGKFFELCQWR